MIDGLRALGVEVEVDPLLVAAAMSDWWPGALRVPQADAEGSIVVRPHSIDATIATVRLLRGAGLRILPMGGRSNVVGALGPRPATAALDLRMLNRIDPVNRVDGTVRAEAGVFGGVLETSLEREGYTLGHYPQSLEISTVGGWISTRATGSFSTLYGGIERHVVGLEVVLADGTLVVQPPRPRTTAGPAILDLFVGAEGRLGVIVAARLVVHPTPEARIFRSFLVTSMTDTLTCLRELIQRGATPAVVRLYDAAETRALGDSWHLRLEHCLLILAFDGVRELAEATVRVVTAALLRSGATDIGSKPAERWYAGRYSYRWLIDGNGIVEGTTGLSVVRPGVLADAIEVCATWAVLGGVIEAGREALLRVADEVWSHVSHAYPHGASVYFIFFVRRASDAEAADAHRHAWSATMKAVLDAGGGIAHHHGIGRARAAWREAENGYVERLRGSVEQALDPGGLFAGESLP
jgi:alkyldihydroxyacetonephosphate synthase